MNLSIIVLVDVPMTFKQIVQSWQSAIDKDEHCQVSHFAVNREVYSELANAGVVSQVVRSALRPGNPATFAKTSEWSVHPTTLARMAFALWAQEMFLRRGQDGLTA